MTTQTFNTAATAAATSILSLNSLSTTETQADNIESGVYESLMGDNWAISTGTPYESYDILMSAIELQMQMKGIKSVANTSAGFAIERLTDTFLDMVDEQAYNDFYTKGLTMVQTMDNFCNRTA